MYKVYILLYINSQFTTLTYLFPINIDIVFRIKNQR